MSITRWNKKLPGFAAGKVLGYDDATGDLKAMVPGSSIPVTNVIFVDKAVRVGTPNGSIQNPYTTISAALASIPAAVDAATSRFVWTVVISPDTYDEDLAIDITGKRIVLTSWGPWNLGVFGAANWLPSGTRRNISITGSAAEIDSIRCAFAITSFDQIGERTSTNQSYVHGARISGKISISTTGSALELDIQAEVFGTTGTSAGISYEEVGAPITQVYLYGGRYRGQFLGGANGNFQHAEKVRFDGLFSIQVYSLLRECRFNNGFTVTSAANAGLFPEGIINSFFAAGTTFTGPAASFRLDTNTNYWVVTNAITLAGGATKVLHYSIL